MFVVAVVISNAMATVAELLAFLERSASERLSEEQLQATDRVNLALARYEGFSLALSQNGD